MFDYKKLIKNRTIRMKILHLLDFIPDSLMLKFQYFIQTGNKLNLKNPQRYTEKIQWYKLYYRNPLMKQCVDKYDVRQYVEQCGLKEILNECYGVFDNAEDVDFNKLPNSFVLKDTLGGGGNDIIIVKNKNKLNINETIERMKEWTNYPYKGKHPGREWAYEGKKHRIIVEKYLTDLNQPNGIMDYKFFCFNGKIFCSYLLKNTESHDMSQLAFFDKDFNALNVYRPSYAKPLISIQEKPLHYDKMLIYAEKLSSKFPAARIDFYNLSGRIIFGEITFFTASGYISFVPDKFDFILGKEFVLPDGAII